MRFVIIADDLTGAADSALPFRRAGFSVVVSTSGLGAGVPWEDADIVSMDLRTRQTLPGTAYLDTFRAVGHARQIGASVFKKVDSQLRGNPADELAGALDAWPGAVAIGTPALPAFGRVVRDGRLHALGAALPTTVEERLVGERDRNYLHLPLEALREGYVAGQLSRLPAGAIALADAEDEHDLAALVEAGVQVDRPVIWVGSAGLAAHVAAAIAPGDEVITDESRLERGWGFWPGSDRWRCAGPRRHARTNRPHPG